MARKTSKPSSKKMKTSLKNSTKSMLITTLEKTEKNFKNMFTDLATQCQKELNTLKQKEKKLMSALKRMQAQEKTAKKKLSQLNKTSAAKKQIITAKKTHELAVKEWNQIANMLMEIKEQAKTLAQKQTKFLALNKHFIRFEKEWSLKSRKTKKTTAKTRKKITTQINHPPLPNVHETNLPDLVTFKEEEPEVHS